MNKTEAAYAGTLEVRKAAGELIGYWYEAVTFKLAKDTRYTPDFLVQLADGTLEANEVRAARESAEDCTVESVEDLRPLARDYTPKTIGKMVDERKDCAHV